MLHSEHKTENNAKTLRFILYGHTKIYFLSETFHRTLPGIAVYHIAAH